MTEHVHDGRGGHLRIGPLTREGVTLQIKTQGEADAHEYEAWMGPVDPQAVIAAIRVAAGLTEDRVSTEHFPNGARKVTTSHADGTTSERWVTPQSLSFEEATAMHGRGESPLQDDAIHEVLDDQGRLRPVSQEEPRLFVGTDEPIIDQLIGRVGDLEEEKERTEAHEHLARHWSDRLDVARQALRMTPRRGESKPTGPLSTMFGYEKSGEVSVTDALKIARFAADEERDIPGVDR